MYFGRKHRGHSVQEEVKICISLRSLPVLQHTCTGCLGKPHLRMERRRHWRVLNTCRVNGCCYYLLLCLAAEQSVFLCPLGAEGMHQKTALFCRNGCWTIPGGRRGFGRLAMLHSWTPTGTYPCPFLSRTGIATTKPLHAGQALTLQQHANPQGKGHLSILWADCVPRKATITWCWNNSTKAKDISIPCPACVS